MTRRPFPWLIVVFGLVGAAITFGGFSTYADQTTGASGTARISDCEGGRKYQPGITCTGTWEAEGRTGSGAIQNTGYGDIGKTVDVRVQGDEATKPGLGTPIALWALGVPILLLALWGLVHWARHRHTRRR